MKNESGISKLTKRGGESKIPLPHLFLLINKKQTINFKNGFLVGYQHRVLEPRTQSILVLKSKRLIVKFKISSRAETRVSTRNSVAWNCTELRATVLELRGGSQLRVSKIHLRWNT